jgi:predicted AlkP superfamily pyrophosphatase or phosphodiesterase
LAAGGWRLRLLIAFQQRQRQLRLCIAAVVVLAGCVPVQHGAAPAEPQTVVLISLDGFRPDYLETHSPPTLLRLVREGVRAQAMRPVFPTLTFPNHYSIVTGLYPESHGIVSNTMYDPVFDAAFSLRNEGPRDDRWWAGEPIWSTAEKQGVRSAAFFWPGTEVEIAGARPWRWMPYDGSVPYETRVDSVLAWLSLPETERPRMITLYFDEPDHTAHEDGPFAATVRGAVLKSDSALGRLVAGLEERGIYDSVNLIVVSDHGMVEVSRGRMAPIADVIDTGLVHAVATGAVFMGWSRSGDNAGLAAALNSMPNVQAWLREDVPERFRFRNHRRITPVVALADEGWMIVWTRESRMTARGMHGYDNALPSMRAFFAARGPAFREGARIPEFNNVDVYPLMARVLGLTPAPNHGTLAIAGAALR